MSNIEQAARRIFAACTGVTNDTEIDFAFDSNAGLKALYEKAAEAALDTPAEDDRYVKLLMDIATRDVPPYEGMTDEQQKGWFEYQRVLNQTATKILEENGWIQMSVPEELLPLLKLLGEVIRV